jgi:hypothetical protein
MRSTALSGKTFPARSHRQRSGIAAANRARVTILSFVASKVSYWRLLRPYLPYLPGGFGIVGVPFATSLAFFFAFFSLGESFVPLFCFLGDLSAMSVHLRPAILVWLPKRMRESIGGGHSEIQIAH